MTFSDYYDLVDLIGYYQYLSDDDLIEDDGCCSFTLEDSPLYE